MADETDKKKESIKPTQLVAGALASITVAYLGSRLGIAGTITGAGIASAISAVVGNWYQRSLDRTSNLAKAKLIAARSRRQPFPAAEQSTGRSTQQSTVARTGTLPLANGRPTAPGQPVRAARTSAAPIGTTLHTGLRPVLRDPAAEAPTRRIGPVPTPATSFLAPTSGSLGDPAAVTAPAFETPPPSTRRRPSWKVVVAVAVSVFVITMGAITGIEALKGSPLSGGDNGTTLGHALVHQATEVAPTSGSTAPPATGSTETGSPETSTTAPSSTPETSQPGAPAPTTGAPSTTTPTGTSTTTRPTTTDNNAGQVTPTG
jgi:hypothetical protein